jgi:hypothetical protein
MFHAMFHAMFIGAWSSGTDLGHTISDSWITALQINLIVRYMFKRRCGQEIYQQPYTY